MSKEPKIKTILYITTQVLVSGRYFSWNIFPAIWYCRVQNKILKLLGEHQNGTVFFRFYPNDIYINPNLKWLEQHNSSLEIPKDSLINILTHNNFDLIVTEGCATTLLEILCTKSQILAFIPKDFIKINEDAKELLKKRVFLAEEEQEYYRMLKYLLGPSEAIKFKEINDEFLFQFGIGDPRSDPIDLSRQAIQSIILDAHKNDKPNVREYANNKPYF